MHICRGLAVSSSISCPCPIIYIFPPITLHHMTGIYNLLFVEQLAIREIEICNPMAGRLFVSSKDGV